MKKRFLMILIAIFIVSFGLFVSCGETSEPQEGNYAIEGVTDISISSSQTEYDFLKGVVGWTGSSMSAVTVDSSAVKFGTVGTYEITYTLGDVSKKANVKVYGTPTIEGLADFEAFYQEDLNVFAGVVGKDSFGVELDVTTNHEFNTDSFGRILYGEHFFRYYVTDSVGNTAYLDRTYTVKQPEGYAFANLTITAQNPETKIDIGDKELSYIVYNGEKVPAGAYTIREGVVDLSYYVVDLGKGSHEFSLTFEGGYSNVVVDMQITPAEYYGRPIAGEDMLWLFAPYDDGDEYGNEVIWDEEEQAIHFINNVVELYDNRGFLMDADYFSNAIEKANAKSMTFEFLLDVENPYEYNDLGFYLGFMPEWYGKNTMQQHFHDFDYQSVTINLTKIEKNGDKYKTLFLLATHGGFYIKNMQFHF